MKTSIKSFTTGIFAAMAFVAPGATAQAQTTPITGWGLESIKQGGQRLAEPGSPAGYFLIINNPSPVSGDMLARALLPAPVTLTNIGDTITFSFNFSFPTGYLSSQAFRCALLNTNSGRPDSIAQSGGALSGQPTAGVWSNPDGGVGRWSGYVADFSTGLGSGGTPNLIAGRDPGTGGNAWHSTSGDYYALLGNQGGTPNNANALHITATTTNQDWYYVSLSVQLVSPNFVNVSILMTNLSGTYTNAASVYDDGTLLDTFGGRSQYAGLQRVSATTFNAVGVFQNGSDGSGIGPFVYSNLTVTVANNLNTGWTNIVIDAFKPAGIGPNLYSSGKLINVWTNWFGAAWVTNTWNSTIDAGGDGTAGSGSLQILADWTKGTQFFVYDHANGINPAVPGLNMADFSCDVQFDSSSALTTNNGVGIFGHLQIGTITGGSFSNLYPQTTGYDIPATNTGWVHINVPINASLNLYEAGISNIVFKIDGNWYAPNLITGTTTLRVDNVKFIENNSLIGVILSNPPPTIAISPATLGMRFFAKSTSQYARNMIAAQNHNESWVDAGHPVSYAITIANLPPLVNAMQVNIYLIPVNGIAGGNITNNTSVDNACTNNFGLLLNATGSNYAATVTFKTNSPGVSLPSVNLVASYGSSTITGPASGDGKWVLTFTDNTHGSITGPGLTAQSFVIPTEVAAYFAGPLAVYIGIQPNSLSGVGKFVDFLNISITNGGNTVIDDFQTDTSPELDASKWATVGTGTPGNVVAVPVGSAYWINWTTPAVGYDVEVNSDLTAANNWINPASYAGYEPGPLTETLMGANIWTLISTGDLPPGVTKSFFRLSNSPKY